MKKEKIIYTHFRIPQCLKTKRKSEPSEYLMYPWNPRTEKFFDQRFPFVSALHAKTNGGKTVCTIIAPEGETFTGIVSCSMSQPYLVDYGEDTALNRARVAQGHECAYCRHIIKSEDGISSGQAPVLERWNPARPLDVLNSKAERRLVLTPAPKSFGPKERLWNK